MYLCIFLSLAFFLEIDSLEEKQFSELVLSGAPASWRMWLIQVENFLNLVRAYFLSLVCYPLFSSLPRSCLFCSTPLPPFPAPPPQCQKNLNLFYILSLHPLFSLSSLCLSRRIGRRIKSRDPRDGRFKQGCRISCEKGLEQRKKGIRAFCKM